LYTNGACNTSERCALLQRRAENETFDIQFTRRPTFLPRAVDYLKRQGYYPTLGDLAITWGTDPKGAPVLLKYGSILQTAFDFLIIAIVIFIMIRGINKLKKPPASAASAAPPRQEVLLEEIRNLLAKR
jgi:hypothetical protein